ncbi:hypothetical protein [Labilibaculum manganireducens]|uniref:Uncharacterized protein n=1 Tax=Labilibaculum manganireducens TaxID=1940525 RepID=A0A2N3HUB7_9BACT|nr:hypothetical protein [Labilibaculum manganireducens]PKQ61621.1 hypothetical protein BZG01_18935 [Labilibaculum manganireducens]
MKFFKSIVLIGLVLICGGVKADNLPSKTRVNSSIDLVSRHLWRGFNSGTAPTIEPTLEFQTGKFTAGAWGAYSFDESYQEIDLYLQYNTPLFQFSLYDFYCPAPDFSNSKFFDFDSNESVHLFDVSAKYKGCAKFPISIMTSVLFYGEMDRDENNDQRYSTYFEFGYSNFIGGKKFSWALGLTPFKGMYDDKMNVVNVNMTMYDKIKFSDQFSLPVRGGLTLNPVTEKLFLTFAVTL